ncbi:unnamed protein product, partial [Brassica rapa subsp. narinosa]
KNSIFSTHIYNFVFQYLLFDLCSETVVTEHETSGAEHETSGAEHGDVVDVRLGQCSHGGLGFDFRWRDSTANGDSRR